MFGIGVCYYPEQWSELLWESDCIRMKELGIKVVRIGEFSWSTIEPTENNYNWNWLDRILELMNQSNLKVILGTPTATPPAWLINKYPEILAYDRDGRPRKFGSRRHYCFSSEKYLEECKRIVTLMASRYGQHPSLYGWQTDNEYGCHDTITSYSPNAKIAFQNWLKDKYNNNIDNLNELWGNKFWSMEYLNFEEIDLPNLTVTEANPSHRLDFQRFSSDQVLKFNKIQCDILRNYSPNFPITHNMMGMITDFDHYALGEQLDFACWDSYPQGFTLDRMRITQDEQKYYLDTGHPDIAAFHHDLYRNVGHGRWWVMEQQPGPVNWAPYNPIPHSGMIRLWSWEAFAHGAEYVTYFRWRQSRHAQEQMHAGLLRPDNIPSPSWNEVKLVSDEIQLIESYLNNNNNNNNIDRVSLINAKIAIIFDYEADWMINIQPQGATASVIHTTLSWYSAIRSLGINIDIISPKSNLSKYELIFIPCQPVIDEYLLKSLKETQATVLFGPRCGSKTSSFSIPENLAPGPLQDKLLFKVAWVASLPPFYHGKFQWNNKEFEYSDWKELIDNSSFSNNENNTINSNTNESVLYSFDNWHYLTVLPDRSFIQEWVLKYSSNINQFHLHNIHSNPLPNGARLQTYGNLQFAFHYGLDGWKPSLPDNAMKLFGPDVLNRGDCACWVIN